MTLPLALTIPLMKDESPPNFAARLAARNHCTARVFAADMDFNFMHVVRGKDAQFSKLADLAGISAASLRSCAVRLTDGKVTLRGQALDLRLLRRSKVVICPKCLEDDIRKSDLPPLAAIYGRTHWTLSSIRTCPIHSLALVTVAERTPKEDIRHDWSQIVSPFVPRLADLTEGAFRRAASEFEVYLLDRLYGRTTDCWLDNFAFFEAEYLTELVGAVAAFGKEVKLRYLSDEERHTAGARGFPIIKDGAAGIVDLLSQLDRDYVGGWKTSGPSSVYGKLYSRLTHGMNHAAYAPVREIMTEHILSKFPIGPGEILFGVPVKTRRIHSIQTAAKCYGIYVKRLRRALEIEGLVPDQTATDHDVLMNVADVERVVLREKQSLTFFQAQERLNVSEVSMNVLVKAGLIHRHRVTSGKLGERFFDYEIDQFLDTLSINAQPVEKENANVMNLRSVARYALRSLSDVIQLILDGKVSWVGRLPEVKGIEALVLRLDEVKAVVRGPTFEGLTAVPAGHFLQITAPVLREIARRGIIKTIRCADPVNRSSRIVFPLAELERFRLDYISLNHLRDGRQGGWVRRKLAADNIMPAEELAGLEATFYKRSDLKI